MLPAADRSAGGARDTAEGPRVATDHYTRNLSDPQPDSPVRITDPQLSSVVNRSSAAAVTRRPQGVAGRSERDSGVANRSREMSRVIAGPLPGGSLTEAVTQPLPANGTSPYFQTRYRQSMFAAILRNSRLPGGTPDGISGRVRFPGTAAVRESRGNCRVPTRKHGRRIETPGMTQANSCTNLMPEVA